MLAVNISLIRYVRVKGLGRPRAAVLGRPRATILLHWREFLDRLKAKMWGWRWVLVVVFFCY